MSHWLDVVVSRRTVSTPMIVGTTRDALVLQSDPKDAIGRSRKVALDVRTGQTLPRLPPGYAAVEQPPAEVAGGAEIRVVKARRSTTAPKAKAIVTVELRQRSGEAFVLASSDDAVGFAAASLAGALFTEPLAGLDQLDDRPHLPRRDTRRLVLTLARTDGPVVTLPLPWWVAGIDPEARRLSPFRVVVCLRARVLCIVGFDVYWLSLDALERLVADVRDGAAVSVRGVVAGTSSAELPNLYTKLTVVTDSPREDPVRALAGLLGWAPEDATREGPTLLLSEQAVAALMRVLQ